MLPEPTTAESKQTSDTNPEPNTHPHQTKYIFAGYKEWITRYQLALANRFRRIKDWRFTQWAQQYNPSQWCYFIAFSLMMYAGFFSVENWDSVIAVIAFVGLVRELLNIFHKVWETTLGKSVTLIMYASTANLALAFAAMKINLITGVEPMPFVFTLGFTTLILMPFWIALSSVVMFSFGLILANLWLLIRLPLKLFGIQLKVHWEDKKHALLTMFMRIILIPFVLFNMLSIMAPYISKPLEGNTFGLTIGSIERPGFVEENRTPEHSEEAGADALMLETEDAEALKARALLIDNAIAMFIYYMEAYPYSACQKTSNQRSVILDDFSVLLISKNPEAKNGYDYVVQKCEPRYPK
ncbi:hypothetical protein [Opacimonas viscosa]|uniref:Uncharacterized protein n=1 Tax=Opacimonas viscosa TaxID=2961944 RepID=A0AA42BM75_9ALTE|nr:hypothetical protein [Opacimonas viscosa]MCP3429683.1 hypothetical protein [Opacimonas viscosa]